MERSDLLVLATAEPHKGREVFDGISAHHVTSHGMAWHGMAEMANGDSIAREKKRSCTASAKKRSSTARGLPKKKKRWLQQQQLLSDSELRG